MNGNSITISYAGKADGDTIKFTRTFGGGGMAGGGGVAAPGGNRAAATAALRLLWSSRPTGEPPAAAPLHSAQ